MFSRSMGSGGERLSAAAPSPAAAACRAAAWVLALALLACAVSAPSALAFQGPWVAPAVSLSASGQSASGPQVAVAPDGTTTATWTRSNGTHTIVQAATRAPGGTFGAPVDLSAAGQSASSQQVAVAPDGTTTATWRRSNGTNLIVQAATRAPGGTFAAPVDLSAAGQNASDQQVAVAADGTTTATWRRSNGTNLIVQAATRAPGGTFAAPVDLSASGQNAFSPQLAVAPDGTTTATWHRSNGTHNIVQAATRASGGTFAAPVDLSASGQNASSPQLAVAPDGTTTATWRRSNGTNLIVQAATRAPGGTFAAPVDLSAAGQNAAGPQLAVAPDGTTTATWDRYNGTNLIVQAATRAPGGAFGAPVDLSAAGQNASGPQLAVAPDGTTTATWERDNGTHFIVQAVFTANPPAARAIPLIAGSAALGATLGCDGGSWTGAAQVLTGWLRAGAQITAGPSHQVTSSDQGAALVCRARASNPYGSTDSLSTPLVIPPAATPPVTPPATTPPVTPPAAAPIARSLPRISGRARIGRTLRCRPGSFTGASTTATSWLRGAKPIKGARKTTYKLTKKDTGKIIACRTSAKNPAGTSTVISLAVLARR